jgi:outer membrane protein assembly factor BamB
VETQLSPATVGRLGVAWTASVGAVDQEPVVAGGRIYVASEGAKLQALDPVTGGTLWTASLGGQAFASPAVAAGRVFVNAADTLAAYDALTGARIWSADNPDSAPYSSPVVAGGIVYVGELRYLRAFNAATGALVWQTTFPVVYAQASTTPAVADGTVYISVLFDGLYALDAATGAVRWSVAGADHGSFGSVAVLKGRVFTSDAAYDAATGALIWSVPKGDSSMAIANGVAYYSWIARDKTERLVARRAASGKFLWHASFGNACCYLGPWSSSPAVANGVVYIGERNGKLDAFDATTGTLLASLQTYAGGTLVSPVVSNGYVFLGAIGGLTAYTLPPVGHTVATG